MTDSLRHRCELLVGNKAILTKEFKFDTAYALSLCSSLYASRKAIADPVRIKAKKALIKKDTNIFSSFRSVYHILSLSTLLSLENECDAVWRRTLEASEALRKRVPSSSYLPIAAYMLATLSKKDVGVTAESAYSLFCSIKKLFPYHRCGDDIVYAALLAVSGADEAILFKSVAECTKYLSRSISKQSLKQASLIFAIAGGDIGLYCRRFLRLRELLANERIAVDKNDRYTLSQIFTLSVLSVPEDALADSVIEVYEHLKSQKGFGFTFGRSQRLVYSIIQVYGEYIPESANSKDPHVQNDVNAVINSVAASVATVISCEITYAIAAVAAI